MDKIGCQCYYLYGWWRDEGSEDDLERAVPKVDEDGNDVHHFKAEDYFALMAKEDTCGLYFRIVL